MVDVSTDIVHRVAPDGFTPEQRKAFDRDGILIVEGAISAADVARYLDAVDRMFPPGSYEHHRTLENVVELDPVFAELIDHLPEALTRDGTAADGQASRATTKAVASATMLQERVWSARSSGRRSVNSSRRWIVPSVMITTPSARRTRRRSARVGVLRVRCARDKPSAASAPSTAAMP